MKRFHIDFTSEPHSQLCFSNIAVKGLYDKMFPVYNEASQYIGDAVIDQYKGAKDGSFYGDLHMHHHIDMEEYDIVFYINVSCAQCIKKDK